MKRRRGVLFWAAIVGGLALAALVLGPPADDDGDPFDPRSTGRLGARALVLLLEDLGGRVTVGERVPGDGTDVALVLDDRLSERQRVGLAAWTRDGGVLVVADEASPLHQAPSGDRVGPELFGGAVDRGRCDIGALRDAERLDVDGGTAFRRQAGSAGCFGDDDQAVIVATPAGDGVVVSVGAPTLLVNERLASASNAVAAAALLAPRPGTAIAVMEAAAPGAGDETLRDLIPSGVIDAVLQLGVAFVVLALWRSRRLGRPVREPQPVQIEGSELVVAVGNLLQRSKDPERSGALLRRDLHRRLTQGLGLPADATPAQVAEAAAARGAGSVERVRDVLTGSPVTTDAELLALATEVDAVLQDVLHGRQEALHGR